MNTTNTKIDIYKDINLQEVKELAEDLNLNPKLAKEIEVWFSNTDIKNSGGNTRRSDLFVLFKKIAIDYYVALMHTSNRQVRKPTEEDEI